MTKLIANSIGIQIRKRWCGWAHSPTSHFIWSSLWFYYGSRGSDKCIWQNRKLQHRQVLAPLQPLWSDGFRKTWSSLPRLSFYYSLLFLVWACSLLWDLIPALTFLDSKPRTLHLSQECLGSRRISLQREMKFQLCRNVLFPFLLASFSHRLQTSIQGLWQCVFTWTLVWKAISIFGHQSAFTLL